MKTRQAKVAFFFTHIFSNTIHRLLSNSLVYFQFACFMQTKNARRKLPHIRVYFAIYLYLLPKLRWSSSARTKVYKTSNIFICTSSFECTQQACRYSSTWSTAVSAALHTPQSGGPTLSQGPKIQSRHHLAPQKMLRSPKLKYEALEISEVRGPFERKVLMHHSYFGPLWKPGIYILQLLLGTPLKAK